jgi:CRP-like cAMP-binding protein
MPISSLALRGCGLFAKVPEVVVARAAAQMDIVQLKRREVLQPDGRPFRGLGVLLQGRIQAIDHTIDGREVALSSIEPGDVFGHANLMAERPFELTWVATSASSVAVMAPEPAMALFQDAQMSLHVAADMAQQVCEFLGWQKILSVHPVSARVCAWLLWHATESGGVPRYTHAELAWRLNTTRESVTRVLQRLQADGVLQLDGEAWRIARMDKLRELSQGEGKA